ncbi:hypothetical protein RB195_023219 [Necator americanus]|uniref:Uncharacterized protein n=1 Tax=Necator americanus TaxID=51031 RepID=A0ABR1EKW0_NECAM
MPSNGITDTESQTETFAEDAECQASPIEQCDQSTQVEPRMQMSREVQTDKKLRTIADATHHEATPYTDNRHPNSAGRTNDKQRRQAPPRQKPTYPP